MLISWKTVHSLIEQTFILRTSLKLYILIGFMRIVITI